MEHGKWVCVNCGSDEVQGKAWVDLNGDDPVIDWSLSEGDRNEYYCLKCKEKGQVIQVDTK